jgi:Tfp pilus assembly protein PilW
MITTTPSLTRKPVRTSRHAAFTLVEIMVGAALASFVLAGVLSAFLFLGRSGANLRNYSDMETQSRQALERFAEDVRQASAITWTSSRNITLAVNSAAIGYYYDTSTQTFYRSTSTGTTALITGIRSGSFVFKPYNVAGALLPLATSTDLAAAGSSTKQLQISLEAARTTATVASATNLVLSARYILRNKIVTA